MSWKDCSYKAIALYPYSSTEKYHLTTTRYDTLEVLKENGDWVFARCISTGCLGICPKSYLGEYKDEIDILNRKFSLEIKYLFIELYKNFLIPAKEDDASFCKILDLVSKIQRTYPLSSDTDRGLLYKYIEELREFIHIKQPERNQNGTMTIIHDITSETKKTTKKQTHQNYQETILMNFAIQSDPQPTPVHIKIFLYNITAKTLVSLQKTSIFTSNHFVDTFLCPDIDPKIINNLAIVVFISDYAEGNNTYFAEYKACGVEKLSTADKPFKIGHDQTFDIKFFTSKDAPISSLYRDILENKQTYTPSIDCPPLKISYSSYQQNCEATNPQKPADNGLNKLGSFKYPINVGSNYDVSQLYVKITHLRHKTKIKPTRIIVRAVDLSSKSDAFVPCFPTEKDPCCAVTTIQRGFLDFDMEEVVQVQIDTSLFPSLDFAFLVFFVERSFKPPGESYISSYCFSPLYDIKNGCMYEFTSPRVLKLIKPPKTIDSQTITTEITNFHSFEECFKEPGDPGFITVETSLISNKFSKFPDVNKLLTTVPTKDATFDDIQILEVQYYYAWGPKILFELAKIIVNDERNSERALYAFVSCLKSIDQYSTRDPFMERVLTSFFAMFVEENSFLSKLGVNLLQFTGKAIDSQHQNNNSEEGEKLRRALANIQRTLASVLRITVVSINFAKKIKQNVNEAQIRNDFRRVFDSTCKKISDTAESAVVQRQFLIRALPHMLQIMDYFFSKKEIVELALIAFNSTPSNVNDRVKVFDHFANAEIFRNEKIRRGLLPEIIKELTKEDYKQVFSEKILPLATTIFFDMLGSSSSFSSAVSHVTPLFANMIGNPDYANQIILFIYYSLPIGVKPFLTCNGNQAQAFTEVTEMILKAVDTAPPSILFALVPAFVKVFLLSQDDQFSQTRKDVILLIKTISNFYRQFLHRLEVLTPLDRLIYNQMYAINLTPISHLLPLLIDSVPPNYHFDSSIFIPLFHMYVSSKDQPVRQGIRNAFGQIFTAEGQKVQAIETPIVDALIAVMSVEGMAEIVSIFDIITQILPSAKQSVEKLTQFSQNLANLSYYPPNASYEDERVTSINFLLEGFKNSESSLSNYPHFAMMLYDLHVALNNQVEAAEVFRNVYQFLVDKSNDDDELRPESTFPAQTTLERKKMLLKRSYELFMQSQFFEHAIECAEELRRIGESKYDFALIAEVCEMEANAWTEVTTVERTQLNRFYGCKFIGGNFDECHKNKFFVYRRGGYFDNGQMLSYIKQKFPNAECSPRPPQENTEYPNGYVYVFNVKPLVEDSYCPEESPGSVMTRTVCRIQRFFSEVPVRVKIEGKKYNEIAEYHRHITEYQVEYPLQGIARRALVVKQSEVRKMSPVECAVFDTNAKSLELLQKASHYWRCLTYNVKFDETAVSAFSMLINGIVNAAVNGGTKLFQELFLEGDLANLPEQKKWAPKLKEAFVTQLKAVNFAISVHDYVVSDAYLPLHNQIKEQFVEMQKSMSSQVGTVDFSMTDTNLGKIPEALPPKQRNNSA